MEIHNKTSDNRIKYLDIAKGVLIFMLVFAHFRAGVNLSHYENQYFYYVYSWNSIFTCFYMPAFFFISGYCSNFKKNIKAFSKNIFYSLFLPLFSLSLINDLARSILVFHNDIFNTLFNTIKSIGTLWFLQALILAKLICFIIQRFTDSRLIMLLITFILLVSGVALSQFKIGSNPFYYQHGLVASFFVALGLYLKENQSFFEVLLKYSLCIYPFIGIINFWYSPNITQYMSVSLKLLPLFGLLSICGTFFLIAVCKRIKRSTILEFWGQNSLVVYGLHWAPLVFFFNFYYKKILPDDIISFLGYIFLLFATEYIICYLLIMMFQYKPFKWFIGKI